MGQKAKSFKISHDLAEASVLRAKYMGYHSWGAYVKTLIRRDIGGDAIAHINLKKQNLFQQDLLDRHLHHMVKEATSRLTNE